MPLDDRIQRLTETIVHEVKGPIEEALHRLFADVLVAASEDRDQAIQSALDASVADRQAALDALRAELERERDSALEDLRGRMERERDASTVALRTQLEHERDSQLADLRAQLERECDETVVRRQEEMVRDHEAALAAVREEAARDHEAALATLREEAARDHEAALATLREEAARDHEAALAALRDEAARDREAQQQAHEAALADVRTAAEASGAAALTAALAEAEHARDDAHARAADLEHQLDQARREAEEARHDAEEARRAAGEAQRAAGDAQQAADRARAEAADQAREVHVSDRQHELACSERILAAFRQLDEARSLTEVLRVVADQAGSEIGRAALLLVTGSRMRGWEWRGIAGSEAPLVAPIEPGTIFARAVATGLPASTSDAPLGADGDPLAARLETPSNRVGLAVPISVGGRVVAILYADDAGSGAPVVPSSWPELAELLARHAGRCLELLTISHAATVAASPRNGHAATAPVPDEALALADEQREEESARRYARLLISEIKLYNESAVEQGRADGDLLARLGPEIERARRLYEEKIPAAVRQRVDCFDEEVVRTLAGGDAGLLGRT